MKEKIKIGISVKGDPKITEFLSSKTARNVLLSNASDGYILSDDSLTVAEYNIKRAKKDGVPPSESSINVTRLVRELPAEHQAALERGLLFIGITTSDKPESTIREVSVFTHVA